MDAGNPLRPGPLSSQTHQSSTYTQQLPQRPERRQTRGPRALPHNGSVSTIAGGGGNDETQRFLNMANGMELSREDRQEGYDTDLLNLQPRGLPSAPAPPESQPATNPFEPDADSIGNITRTNSYDVEGLLTTSGPQGREKGMYSYVSRAADGGDIEKGRGRRERSGRGRTRSKKPEWWHRKICWVLIFFVFVVVGAAVGLGVGLGLEHHQNNVAAATSSTVPTISATDNRPTPSGASTSSNPDFSENTFSIVPTVSALVASATPTRNNATPTPQGQTAASATPWNPATDFNNGQWTPDGVNARQ